MFTLLQFASIWAVLLPAIVGVFFYNWLGRTSKIIWVMALLAVIPQMVRIMPVFNGNRYVAYNIYTIIECFFSAWFLLEVNQFSKGIKKIVGVGCSIFLTVFVLQLFFNNIKTRFYYEGVVVCNLMIVAGVLLMIYHTILNQRITMIWQSADAYFIVGLFIYTPVTVIIYSLWDFLQKNENSSLSQLWIIHHIANFIMYLLFAVGIAINRYKPAQPQIIN